MDAVDERVDGLEARLLEDLRERLDCPALRYVEPPERIQEIGAENSIVALRLEGAPADLAGPLILRLYRPARDPAGVRAEAVVHTELAAQGYPAPRVHLVCDDPEPLGGGYLLMERMPGRVLLGEIARLEEVFGDVWTALKTVPRMLYEGAVSVPRECGRWMRRLHEIDPAPVVDALERAGFPLRGFTAEGRLEDMTARAKVAALDGLLPALEWLREHHRAPERRVVCHADFHFLNLLMERGRVCGVVDWSHEHFCIEAPAFDVGNTRALFAIDLPGIPSFVQPLFRAAQRDLVRSFTKHYDPEESLDADAVRWAEAYRYARELVYAGEAVRRGEGESGFLGDGGNPWLVPEVMRSTIAGIEERTGIAVSLPEPA